MLQERRAREEATATLEERVAGAITRFSGTMRFTQNRMSAAADKRAELDLQISLLAEHEVTKLAALLWSPIAWAWRPMFDAEVEELKEDVAPEAVLDEIEERRQ